MPSYNADEIGWVVEPDRETSPLVNYLVPNVPLPTNPLTQRVPSWYYLHRPLNNRYTPIVEDGMYVVAPSSNYIQVPVQGYQLGYNSLDIPDPYTGYLDDWAFPNTNQ